MPIEELPAYDLPPDEMGEAWQDSLPDSRPDEGERAGSSAICVRSCDGGYFPLTVKARTGKLTDLQELCTALCPNVEAKLYTLPAGGNVAEAVNPAGEVYSRHPNAFLFRKKYDAACAEMLNSLRCGPFCGAATNRRTFCTLSAGARTITVSVAPSRSPSAVQATAPARPWIFRITSRGRASMLRTLTV